MSMLPNRPTLFNTNKFCFFYCGDDYCDCLCSPKFDGNKAWNARSLIIKDNKGPYMKELIANLQETKNETLKEQWNRISTMED
ncbi:MAG: hypothetical protein ABIO44_03715, partial [Saprospiraceae bacterium]